MANDSKRAHGTALSTDDLDSVQGGADPGINPAYRIGDYNAMTRSFGLFSLTDTNYRDSNTGEQFTASTVGIGPSWPGWSAAAGNVYRSEGADPNTSVRSVVTGAGWQGGFGDVTGIGEGGYTLQTGGSPYVGLERTYTGDGITTQEPRPAPGLDVSSIPVPANLPETQVQDLYGFEGNYDSSSWTPPASFTQQRELNDFNTADQANRDAGYYGAFGDAPTGSPAATPSNTEPSYTEPGYTPSNSEPSYTEPSYTPNNSEPSYTEPSYTPNNSEPSYSEPSYSQPAAQEPSYSEPAAQEPSYSEPAATNDSYSDGNYYA